MKIHKEGRTIILTTIAFSVLTSLGLFLLSPIAGWIGGVCGTLLIAFTFFFFRSPKREPTGHDDQVFAPADGEVVAIEVTEENEYFKDKRLQISVFMSIWNVHVNWFPVGGRVEYFRHHHGKHLVAWHPKSSELNERTSIVLAKGDRKVMFRQIAGTVARRIVSYARIDKQVGQNTQCGFIKFGSRVDIFLPEDCTVKVKLGDRVTGTKTILAEFPK